MSDPETRIDRAPSGTAKRTYSRRSIAASVLFHVIVIGVLWFWLLPDAQRSDRRGELASPKSGRETGSPSELAPSLPSPKPVSSDAEVPPEQIEASLESQIKSVESLPLERKLGELEKNLSRLQAVATEESVRDVTSTIANALNLSPGPVPTEVPAAGEFDPETAQIHDVTRVQSDKGGWQYTSTLVDAHGRTQAVPLSQSEGETVYRTFEQLKRYPMADGIYRQLVMPTIQKMIQASELTEQMAEQAKRMQQPSGDTPGDFDSP